MIKRQKQEDYDFKIVLIRENKKGPLFWFPIGTALCPGSYSVVPKKQFVSVPPCLRSSVSHLACCDGWNVKCLPWAQLLNSTWLVVLSGRCYRTFRSPSRRGSPLRMGLECELPPHPTQFALSASCSGLVTGSLKFLWQVPANTSPLPLWTVILKL